MFVYTYYKWRVFYGAEGLESRLKNRVIRWAAGYNVVRVRQSDRRFKFSQYPDSKILITSGHEISTSFWNYPGHMLEECISHHNICFYQLLAVFSFFLVVIVCKYSLQSTIVSLCVKRVIFWKIIKNIQYIERTTSIMLVVINIRKQENSSLFKMKSIWFFFAIYNLDKLF